MTEIAQLVPGTQHSYRHPWGYSSARAGLSHTAWRHECDAVSTALTIAPEQNLGLFSLRYAVRILENPLRGLLGARRCLVWLIEGAGRGKIVTMLEYKNPILRPSQILVEHKDLSTEVWAQAFEPDRFPETTAGARERERWAEHEIRRRLRLWRREAMAMALGDGIE